MEIHSDVEFKGKVNSTLLVSSLYVDGQNGSDENSGLTSDKAFRTITAALNASMKYDSPTAPGNSWKWIDIYIAEGTYDENLNVHNSVSLYALGNVTVNQIETYDSVNIRGADWTITSDLLIYKNSYLFISETGNGNLTCENLKVFGDCDAYRNILVSGQTLVGDGGCLRNIKGKITSNDMNITNKSLMLVSQEVQCYTNVYVQCSSQLTLSTNSYMKIGTCIDVLMNSCLLININSTLDVGTYITTQYTSSMCVYGTLNINTTAGYNNSLLVCAISSSVIFHSNSKVTFAGSADYVVSTYSTSSIFIASGCNLSGNVSGSKFICHLGSQIHTQSAGNNRIPGTSAGLTNTANFGFYS